MKLREIFTFENLYQAHKKCRNSKQHKGEVIRFEINLSVNISNLMNEINSKKYNIGKYKQFMIYDPKERVIEALPYKDRVVLMCFCDHSIISKIEKSLIYDNAACRKGKGTHFSINRLIYFLKKEYMKKKDNNIYYLKGDIKKYFPNINHNILLKQLKSQGFSNDEIWLIKMFLKTQSSNKDIGLPLGNQSSQWLALFYLNSLDRLIKEKLKIKGYVRYMDDMILIHRDKRYLQNCLKEIKTFCEENLSLSFNQKTQIGKVSNGIDFLGFRHTLTTTGKVIIKLRNSAKVRLKRHLKTLIQLKKIGLIDDEYIYIRKNAYYNHIKDSNESRKLKDKVKPKKC